MTVRIERHKVSEKALARATEDFFDEASIRVRDAQDSGRNGLVWRMLSRDLVDYAGARSVAVPETDADICVAVYSAAEARIGGLKLDGAPTSAEFSVHLTYTGTGVIYQDRDDTSESAPRGQRPVSPSAWAEALYLCVVADTHAENKGALISFAADFDESVVLHRALAYYCFPETGAEREQLVGYVEPALAPFFASLGRRPGDQHPDVASVSPDLLFLHTLLTRNEEAFWTLMSERLAWFRDHRADASPGSLLPMAELAFAALAVRVEGWEMPFESAYLPRRLVEGERRYGKARVGPYGADKDAEAVRALAEGSLNVERPTGTFPTERDVERTYSHEDENLEAFVQVDGAARYSARRLQTHAWSEILGFRLYSVVDPDADHPRQLAALTHASQYTAAALASANGQPGETVHVTVGDTPVPLLCVKPSSEVSEGARTTAIEYALVSGSRARLDTLVAYPQGAFLRKGEGNGFDVFPRYREALLAYLKAEQALGWRRREQGEDRPSYGAVRAAVDDAVAAFADFSMPDFPPPPVVMLSQLVAGDREGFELALADTLERYREVYSIGDRSGHSDSLIDPPSLALACLARAQGWEVRVRSGYLPRGVLDRAAGMFA